MRESKPGEGDRRVLTDSEKTPIRTVNGSRLFVIRIRSQAARLTDLIIANTLGRGAEWFIRTCDDMSPNNPSN